MESAINEFNLISIDEDREFVATNLRRELHGDITEYSYTVARGNRGEDSINMSVAIPLELRLLPFGIRMVQRILVGSIFPTSIVTW